MTNLEILIKFLNLTGEEKQNVILENFDRQNSNTFYINGDEYKLFTIEELEDILIEKEQARFDDMLEYLTDSEFWKIEQYLDSDKYIRNVISYFQPEKYSFDDIEYIGEDYNKFIYLSI